MHTGVKIALGVIGGLVVLVGGTCGGAYFWFSKNSERLREEGKVVMQEGASFGRGKTGPDCVVEGVARLKDGRADGVMSEAMNKVFVESCLKTAAVDTQQFCAGVPPRNEIMQSALWAVGKCTDLGAGSDSQPCARLVGAIQERCETPR